ncbi:MAG: hypothetical protein R3C17_05070 [Planctomycetaceae bacterium]
MSKHTLSQILHALRIVSRGLWSRSNRRSGRTYLHPVQRLEDRALLSDVFPYMVSIDRNPSGAFTNASSVDFAATFSEPVTGVDVADFSLVAGGTIASTLTTVTNSGDDIHYTITVSGITGDGTLGLNLVDNGTIKDFAGNGIITPNSAATFSAQQTYTTDVLPRFVAVGDVNGDGNIDVVTANFVPAVPSKVSVLLVTGVELFHHSRHLQSALT